MEDSFNLRISLDSLQLKNALGVCLRSQPLPPQRTVCVAPNAGGGPHSNLKTARGFPLKRIEVIVMFSNIILCIYILYIILIHVHIEYIHTCYVAVPSLRSQVCSFTELVMDAPQDGTCSSSAPATRTQCGSCRTGGAPHGATAGHLVDFRSPLEKAAREVHLATWDEPMQVWDIGWYTLKLHFEYNTGSAELI